MNVLLAPNSMKGSLNAFDFTDTMEKAFKACSPRFSIRKVPVADGGDFTGEVLRRALHGREVRVQVSDPLGRKITSGYAVSGKTAVIEMADASGMKQLSRDELNPMETSSYGTGQLIAHAMESGCNEIWLGIGGSATVDGGAGMLEALGFGLMDREKRSVEGKGKNLEQITFLEKPETRAGVSFKIISDVNNPLLGSTGAAAVFGPQKGASPSMVHSLERGLENWGHLLEKESRKKLVSLKGAGAAGGIALPLLALFDAGMVPGARFILEKLDFEKHVQWADLVITGEGKIDGQSLHDKASFAVAQTARKHHKPVIGVGGWIEEGGAMGFDAVFSFVNRPVTLEESMDKATQFLYDFSRNLASLLAVFL